MVYIKIGKIVNTHALKGEVRLISNFEYKDRVFKVGNILYVGQLKTPLEIESYRVHKQFDMVKFVGIDYINDVLKYKGSNVYFNEEDLNLNENELLNSDFPLMELYNDKSYVGKIEEYRCDNGNEMIRVNGKYIPYNKDFIERIDKANKKIYMHDIGVFL
ncbi:MAG: ribosome maturation factor RimM [Bacilli bacterium]